MDINYWAATYLAYATLKAWLKPVGSAKADGQGAQTPSKPRHFIITSSVVAYAGLAGYTPYAPAKAALRSLCDTLHSELNLYNGYRRNLNVPSSSKPSADIKIHCVTPATITSPGYEEEEKVKHAVTKKLEEGDPQQNEDEVAASSVNQLENGAYLISTTFLGKAMRWGSLGNSPRNNWFVDTGMSGIVTLAWLFIGPDMEGKVWKWGKGNEVKLPSE
jgi:3-dehydrosphinganine reductase